MKRISDEDGRVAGARNFGRLALAAIPFALGIGASVWLGVWIQAHYFLIDRAQEQRQGSYVGAPDPQRAPYIIETINFDIKVDQVQIERGQMTVRFHNSSDRWRSGLQLHWQWFSPDKTMLKDHWRNCIDLDGPTQLDPGGKGIVTAKDIRSDARAAGVKVWFAYDN